MQYIGNHRYITKAKEKNIELAIMFLRQGKKKKKKKHTHTLI